MAVCSEMSSGQQSIASCHQVLANIPAVKENKPSRLHMWEKGFQQKDEMDTKNTAFIYTNTYKGVSSYSHGCQ